MKNAKNILKYITISTLDERYRISALIEEDKYVMPSLECTIEGESQWCWDNEKFLIDNLVPILRGERGFKEVENDLPIEDFKDVLELFEEAIKMKIFNNEDC